MSDYIKREDAIRTMAQYMMDMALIDNPEASDRIEQWEGSIAAPVMSTVKAADVVEVVRCKDCKYWQDQEEGIVEVPICARIQSASEENPLVMIIGENGYCSYGERADA